MKESRFWILVLAGLLIAGSVSAQKLYKWVDEDGNVHYSDQVPPDQVKHGREQLNQQGVVVETVERELTEEEKAARDAEIKAAEERARQLEEQRIADRKLLAIYSSEEDIIRSKEQQIESIDRAIAAAQAFVDGQSKSLASLLERAARQEDEGQEIDASLRSSIQMAQEQIRVQEEFIAEKEAEKVATAEHFDQELARYREVMQRQVQAQEPGDGSG